MGFSQRTLSALYALEVNLVSVTGWWLSVCENCSFDEFGGSHRVKQGLLEGTEKLRPKKEEVQCLLLHSVSVCTWSPGSHRQKLKTLFLL